MSHKREADRWYLRIWAWWTKDHLARYNAINERLAAYEGSGAWYLTADGHATRVPQVRR